ncbi:MAG TPA: hypothetical protein VJ279_08540 [Hanamia sp.]|jgi:hypothetical protein|nr:hypothetical protein [Hanamia sp.]
MSKFTPDRIPRMKPKEKPKKKLGLLTGSKRQNITMRFQNDTLDRLDKIQARAHEAINFKISRTDIIEALILDTAENRTNTEIKNMLIAFGKGDK